MEWWALLREAFDVSRRGRTLWALALVSLLQNGILVLLLGVVIVPFALATVSVVLPAAEVGGSVLSWSPAARILDLVSEHRIAWVAGVLVVFCAWAVGGVLDVAASSGAIAQTARIADCESTSFLAGMKIGFSVWWRVVSVLAIAAIPVLAAAFIAVLGLLFAVSVPMSQGVAPDPLQLHVGMMLQSGVDVLAGAAALPLTILATLGMRAIVLEGVGWREGWRGAVRMARAHLLDVLIVIIILMGSNLVFEMVFLFIGALFGLVLGAISLMLSLSLTSAVIAAGAFLVAEGALFFVAMTVWQSVVWTLFWRKLRHLEHVSVLPMASADSMPVIAWQRDA